ncbi:hypothetical protein DQK91_21805 [Oceanidesulfovibrio marinus]|uniref:Uncharacterized protein n=1 Tax=Oceanidesulfovibrio marinus TaxID=370038 RepID=A0A6P1ZBW6_9BACT|nr:hypothetical protein DQK91_21805 [Oceanidesulfovibrio marinus]
MAFTAPASVPISRLVLTDMPYALDAAARALIVVFSPRLPIVYPPPGVYIPIADVPPVVDAPIVSGDAPPISRTVFDTTSMPCPFVASTNWTEYPELLSNDTFLLTRREDDTVMVES